ncbi:hypothetical protein BV911_07630 [Pseudoruegeria sp. SK021]|nr:hypothetical protein BV911_07630 [Pseudoruegeria sp. SK021]
MATPSSQASAKNLAMTLLREARAAGWARAKLEVRPDGSVTVDAGMTDLNGDDDFMSRDLRMGK